MMFHNTFKVTDVHTKSKVRCLNHGNMIINVDDILDVTVTMHNEYRPTYDVHNLTTRENMYNAKVSWCDKISLEEYVYEK